MSISALILDDESIIAAHRRVHDHGALAENGISSLVALDRDGCRAAVAGYFGLIEASRYVLAARMPLKAADAIIVLGGDSISRPVRAAELYRRGLAPLVIVSGGGDCLDAEERLRVEGVDPSAIRIECLSHNTAENAAFSAGILHDFRLGSAIVVTSWFHSMRSLRCFNQSAPDVEILMDWSGPPPPFWRMVGGMEGRQVLVEYLKSIWYRLPFADRC